MHIIIRQIGLYAANKQIKLLQKWKEKLTVEQRDRSDINIYEDAEHYRYCKWLIKVEIKSTIVHSIVFTFVHSYLGYFCVTDSSFPMLPLGN